MSQEIKFRGQRIDTKEWVYGYLFGSWEWRYILWGTTNDIPNMIEVIPETVGQYTGLNDKSGIEIYDGDIMECYQKGQTIRGQVVLNDGCYFVKFSNDQKAWIDGAIKQFKANVIGNIHDNHKLLEPR